MQHQIQLGTLRNMRDREQNLPNDSPLTRELHERRGKALHDIFDSDPNFTVIDWGFTDSEEPHEFVTITLIVAAKFALHHAIIPGVLWLGPKLAEKLVEDQVIEAAKDIVGKIWQKMKAKDIDQAQVTVPVANATAGASSATAAPPITIYVINNAAGGIITINPASGSPADSSVVESGSD